MKYLRFLLAITAISLYGASGFALERPTPEVALQCDARDSSLVRWHAAEPTDAVELARWCRAVGGPLFVNAVKSQAPPLDEFVALTWNAHLAEGQLPQLIAELKAGAFTDGRPVKHFALLVQELYRRGDQVPPFNDRDRTAFAISARDPKAADVEDHAAAIGLSVLYVPSMRNGAELREDRGNAIVSTEPLHNVMAIELPLARQRRVAIGARVNVQTPSGVRALQLINAHLEPLSAPHTLWLFKNPRGRQVRAILDLLESPPFKTDHLAGMVLGGDFNTVLRGDKEDGYRHARAWSHSLRGEDRRRTHKMGRLDYLFFRLNDGWSASTQRLDRRFGSDHHPVIGTFARP